jgi:hypothetical protein
MPLLAQPIDIMHCTVIAWFLYDSCIPKGWIAIFWVYKALFLKKSKRHQRYCEYRRKSPYNLDYFFKGGRERRNG